MIEPTFAKVSVLKLDKDCVVSDDWLRSYVHIVILPVCAAFGVKVMSVKMCHSRRRGVHFYIRIDPLIQPDLANRLQFLLGDDPQRVSMNGARILACYTEWNRLFEAENVKLWTIYRAGDQH